MNTRRYPRTMDQAFGPYHRSSQCPIEPMPERMHPADRIVIKWSVICVTALVVIFALELLA